MEGRPRLMRDTDQIQGRKPRPARIATTGTAAGRVETTMQPKGSVHLLPDHDVLLLAGEGMTVSERTPCAPRTSTPSMSAVAEGPVISTA